MIVVADTTPIISLLKIGHLELLQTMFGSVMIPRAVYDELTSEITFADEVVAVKNATFLDVRTDLPENVVNMVRKSTGLDLGESEALVLSEQANADLLLMDEAKGRKIAKLMNFNIMGTVGLLIKAFQLGILSKEQIERSIVIMKSSGRFISEAIYDKIYQIINK